MSGLDEISYRLCAYLHFVVFIKLRLSNRLSRLPSRLLQIRIPSSMLVCFRWNLQTDSRPLWRYSFAAAVNCCAYATSFFDENNIGCWVIWNWFHCCRRNKADLLIRTGTDFNLSILEGTAFLQQSLTDSCGLQDHIIYVSVAKNVKLKFCLIIFIILFWDLSL